LASKAFDRAATHNLTHCFRLNGFPVPNTVTDFQRAACVFFCFNGVSHLLYTVYACMGQRLVPNSLADLKASGDNRKLAEHFSSQRSCLALECHFFSRALGDGFTHIFRWMPQEISRPLFLVNHPDFAVGSFKTRHSGPVTHRFPA